MCVWRGEEGRAGTSGAGHSCCGNHGQTRVVVDVVVVVVVTITGRCARVLARNYEQEETANCRDFLRIPR